MPDIHNHRVNADTLARARHLRERLTPPERRLWSRLRDRQLGGHKFRRQHEIGRYVVDFCCAEARLVVELDGDSHVEQSERDRSRTEWLRQQGYLVVRFTNREVMSNLEGVLEAILAECIRNASQRSAPPSPSP